MTEAFEYFLPENRKTLTEACNIKKKEEKTQKKNLHTP